MKTILISFVLLISSAAAFAQKTANISAHAGVQVEKNSMPSRLSMTPTTTRQTQGQTFGEKVSQGMQAADEEKRTYTGGRKNEPQEAVVSPGVGGMSKPGGVVSSSYAAGRVAGGPLKGIDVKMEK